MHATVVLAERPTSAKPGDEALVFEDGTIEGFVGGTCVESTVREQALLLLESGETLMLRITPVAEAASATGRVVVHNPCLSGGTLELFLEPHVPSPLVIVVGQAPIALALQAIGEQLRYDVRPMTADLPNDAAAVVVASHGRGEERALVAALEAGVPYVGLVASRTRGQAVVDSLDVPAELRARVRTPAGLDIGARSPEEVAVSILAEIVSVRPRPASRSRTPAPAMTATAVVSDPVCGMKVAPVDDTLHYEYREQVFWFCGSGCLQAFRADPDAYAT